jgi:hypothetical protein
MRFVRAAFPLLFLALLVVGVPVNSEAVTILFANMTNEAENPDAIPTTAAGAPRTSFGLATFVLNDAMTALSVEATVVGIDVTGTQSADPNDNLTAAHIHASPTVTPETNAGVVWGFFGQPFNNNNPADGVLTPFASGVGGTFTGTWNAPEGNSTTLAAQLSNILSEHAYINFHTTQFGGGEIRGTLIVSPTQVVPAPASLTLLGVGGVGLLGYGWIHRTRSPRRR